ncbi:OTU-domain-containing protein [Dothidotthia symphoricarpi CBS 119687]|uniref:OTU-domain-containing protein n=1 Tax=Dothidotthia symphoricarpi CBS 119687 TaxID=1392245 RepID=A0A6A6ACL3_9PLEO|nr:OTU-domain-containing protein [Dothidotthia symphoricarpi CBS 119687]KAF2129559.1 OTU-domain-containing protein [Dothidotthia symphoricarpi CBS 119687]
MAPRKSRANSPEFPILESNGLYAGEIRGDGNCLFNALSDQLYGHQEMHEVLRATTIEHMRGDSDFYRQYMAVNNVRRNPKRKTTNAACARIDTSYYTEEQLQQQFEDHVEKMGQPGEWADNMEVSAFASALNVHVRLWQADYTYLFSPRVYYTSNDDLSAEDDRQTLHIAYHSWEHYSSVRNTAGPHIGVPKVYITSAMLSKKRPSPSVDGDDDDQRRRARKRRSPLPLFDSDSTPEGTESSSDESSGAILSQQSIIDIAPPQPIVKPYKLTIKLRGLRTTDPLDLTTLLSRTSTPVPIPSSAPTRTSTPTPTQTPTKLLTSATTPLRTQTPAPTLAHTPTRTHKHIPLHTQTPPTLAADSISDTASPTTAAS